MHYSDVPGYITSTFPPAGCDGLSQWRFSKVGVEHYIHVHISLPPVCPSQEVSEWLLSDAMNSPICGKANLEKKHHVRFVNFPAKRHFKRCTSFRNENG